MKKLMCITTFILICFSGTGFCADKIIVIPLISTQNDSNLIPENIKCGVTILGVTGTLTAIGNVGPAGGIVFFVTPGSGGLHGLEAAPVDQNGIMAWDIAMSACGGYELNGFTDWYLPSKEELYLLYNYKSIVGGFSSVNYWSSSQVSSTNAWAIDFEDRLQHDVAKNTLCRVRPIRAF